MAVGGSRNITLGMMAAALLTAAGGACYMYYRKKVLERYDRRRRDIWSFKPKGEDDNIGEAETSGIVGWASSWWRAVKGFFVSES